MEPEYFHFLRPLWFIALIPALVLFGLLWQGQRLVGRWKEIIAPHLLPYLMEGEMAVQKRFALTGVLLFWIITVIALAGPAWTRLPEPVEQTTSPLVICWDLSPSMLAEDVKPSRLIRSRLKIVDLLKAREEGLTALIAYSGEAYVVTPLTDDSETIINLLPALSPTTLPTQGSNPEMAYEKALELLSNAGALRGDIIFITDEITTDALDVLKDEIVSNEHQLTVWGVGTEAGGPIPLPQGGFAKRGSSIAVVKLNERELQQFTADTNSFYVPMIATDNDVQTIEQLLSIDLEASKQSERVFDQWFEHGQYLVYFLLPFMLFAFRRGWLMSLVFAFPLLQSPNAQAVDWQSLWKTKDQQAQELMQAEDYEGASETFEDKRWQATAQFKAQKFDEAAENFAKAGSSDDGKSTENKFASDYYNEANALTFAGQYDDAIKRYEEALALRSDFTEAQENKAIAEKLKALQEQQNQEQQSDQNQENSEQQDSQDQQNSESQQQDSQQQDGEQQSQESEQQQSQQSEQQESEQQQAQQGEENEEGEEQQSAQQKDEEEMSEEEKEALAKQEEQEAAEKEQQEQQLAQMQEGEPQSEEEQKLEQWLRKVPDDPSGLLRKKFWHEHKTRQRDNSGFNAQRQKQQAEQRW